MKVKKLVQERKLKLTIWNLGTLSKKKKKNGISGYYDEKENKYNTCLKEESR